MLPEAMYESDPLGAAMSTRPHDPGFEAWRARHEAWRDSLTAAEHAAMADSHDRRTTAKAATKKAEKIMNDLSARHSSAVVRWNELLDTWVKHEEAHTQLLKRLRMPE